MQTVPAFPLSQPAPSVLAPNAYALSGDNVRVDYSADSISGDPLLHYRDSTHEVNARGKEIRREEVELGTLVSVSLESEAGSSLLLTVVIPRARLLDRRGKVPIATQAVLTRTRLLPRLPSDAQLQTYQFLPLKGSASFVVS